MPIHRIVAANALYEHMHLLAFGITRTAIGRACRLNVLERSSAVALTVCEARPGQSSVPILYGRLQLHPDVSVIRTDDRRVATNHAVVQANRLTCIVGIAVCWGKNELRFPLDAVEPQGLLFRSSISFGEGVLGGLLVDSQDPELQRQPGDDCCEQKFHPQPPSRCGSLPSESTSESTAVLTGSRLKPETCGLRRYNSPSSSNSVIPASTPTSP